VPSESGAIRDNATIANMRVVADMRVRHKEILIAYRGYHSPSERPWLERDILANYVPTSDSQLTRLALILEILWCRANGGELVDRILVTDERSSFKDDMRSNPIIFPQNDVGTDDRIWTDRRSFSNRR
jgi:hypothetical protein